LDKLRLFLQITWQSEWSSNSATRRTWPLSQIFL